MSAGVPFHVVRDAELKAIRKRRSHHRPDSDQQNHLEKDLVGLTLSGGGVRSASFGLGVVQALDERGLFRDVDYLSTVSGGGYLGGYISALALDIATPQESVPTRESALDTAGDRGAEGKRAASSEGDCATPPARHSITPIVCPSNEPQNRRVRRLVYSGDYLRSALGFLNRYVFGLILVNVFAFSGILTVAAGLAWLFRLLDGVSVSSALKIFGFGSDMTRAFFPAFVCGVLWAVCWVLSYWSSAAAKASKYLLGLLIAAVSIAVAALLGTGDIGIADLPRLFSLNPTTGDVNAIADVLRVVIIAPLILFLVPYLNPRRFLKSGLSPKSVWERLTFKIVSFALLIGIPLLAFGYLARENVSGVNDRRDGTFRSSSEVRNWNDGNAPFWQRVEGESDEAKRLLAFLNDPALIEVATDNGFNKSDRHIQEPIDALFRLSTYLTPDPISLNDFKSPKDPVVIAKLRQFRKDYKRISGTEFVSHAIWTARGTIDNARMRNPGLPIPATVEELADFLSRSDAAAAPDSPNGRKSISNRVRRDIDNDLDAWLLPAIGTVGVAAMSPRSADAGPLLARWFPSNELLRDVLVERIRVYNSLDKQANASWYSPYFLAAEGLVSTFNTPENEPEEIVRLHRLQVEIEVLRVLMLENLNAAISNAKLETQLPTDEDVQDNIFLRFLTEPKRAQVAELRHRIKSLQRRHMETARPAAVSRENRKLIQDIYPNVLADERQIFRWAVLPEDQQFRARFLFGAAVVFLISGFLVNLQATSPQGYYRQQLHATWLSDQRAFRGDVRLSQVNTTSEGYPYHLIVATANYLRATHDGEHLGATDLFLLSRLYCGSDRTGYQPTNDYAGGTYDLASAIAVSAGALSPSQIKNLFVATMAMLLNLRLGEWLPNPGYHPKRLRGLRQRLQRWPAPFVVAPSVLRAGPLERRAFCFVTDGGHYENLGVAPLLKRRCRLIICVDAGHDPDYRFQDFAALERRMRVCEGIVFSAVDSDKLPDEGGKPVSLAAVVPKRLLEQKPEPRGAELPPEKNAEPKPADAPAIKRRDIDDLKSRSHFVVFKIWYPPDETGGVSEPGYCIYIKPAFTGNEDLDLISFASQNREFPHDSTADQFYEPDKFESYRQLGYHTGITVAAEAIAPGISNGRLGNWLPPTKAASSIDDALAGLCDLETPPGQVRGHSELLVDCLQRGELDRQQQQALRRHAIAQSRRFLKAEQWESLEHLVNVLKALAKGARPALLELFAATPAPAELRRLAGDLLTQVGLTRSAKARRAVESVVKDDSAPDDLRTTAAELLEQVASDSGASD